MSTSRIEHEGVWIGTFRYNSSNLPISINMSGSSENISGNIRILDFKNDTEIYFGEISGIRQGDALFLKVTTGIIIEVLLEASRATGKAIYPKVHEVESFVVDVELDRKYLSNLPLVIR